MHNQKNEREKETNFALIAAEYESVNDYDGMFNALSSGLAQKPYDYELYYSLGFYYLRNNINQAYLCFQNALYYCRRCLDISPDNISLQNDYDEIMASMTQLAKMEGFSVRDTAIIIVAFNSLYLQQQNIESIRTTLMPGTYKIIVIDNGSTDGCREWLSSQPDLHLIANEKNLGFATACNQGAACCSDYDLFLLNNDTRLSENSLFWLKMGLYENADIGATGAVSNYAGNMQEIELSLNLPAEYVEYGVHNNIPLSSPYEEKVRLSGFAMLIKANLWSEIDGMDELFTPGYFEDDDLSMKLLRAGYRLYLCKNSFIYHAGSQSFAKRDDINELLLSHHKLFVQKYGFDILSFCEPDYNRIAQIDCNREDAFNLLVVGCGLGAEMMIISQLFPNANIIGFEKNETLHNISSCIFPVFMSAAELADAINSPVFMTVLVTVQGALELDDNDLKYFKPLLTPNCKIISRKQYDIPFEKIKLVVWDLDDTFWKGTLSEERIEEIPENISLVVNMTDCGIINSISSKNNESSAINALNRLNITGAFVFNNINWLPKGPQLFSKIEAMHLRPENVLYIDDNPRNLEEAKFCVPGIMVSGPEIISHLAQYVSSKRKTDPKHTRLSSYKQLEEKYHGQKNADSPEAFLRSSNIRIEIKTDCLEYVDRIYELINRANQLNYTKVRCTKEELYTTLDSPANQSGCVFAIDNYCDYGMIGFFCMNANNNSLLHFLFSCRVMGMGIEQYLYSYLHFPSISVVPPVAISLDSEHVPDWISLSHFQSSDSLAKSKWPRILLKGPCDMDSIAPLLKNRDISTEFNYINGMNFITTAHNHSIHIVSSLEKSDKEICSLITDVPFLTMGDFDTTLFTECYDIICMSMLPDCESGVYRRKSDGQMICFGNRNFDLTDQANLLGYCNGTIPNHMFPFTHEIITDFSQKWEFVGHTPVDILIKNLTKIHNALPGSPTLILILGSEIAAPQSTSEFANAADVHKEVNPAITEWAKSMNNVEIINITDFITSTHDFLDCTNHFSKKIYYNLAEKILSIIEEKKE